MWTLGLCDKKCWPQTLSSRMTWLSDAGRLILRFMSGRLLSLDFCTKTVDGFQTIATHLQTGRTGTPGSAILSCPTKSLSHGWQLPVKNCHGQILSSEENRKKVSSASEKICPPTSNCGFTATALENNAVGMGVTVAIGWHFKYCFNYLLETQTFSHLEYVLI